MTGAPADILALASAAQRSWLGLADHERRDAMETYAMTSILIVRPGAMPIDLWCFPASVSMRIVLDFGCRQEARRRGHDFEAEMEIVTAQAVALQSFRASLDARLRSISDWPALMEDVRKSCAATRAEPRGSRG